MLLSGILSTLSDFAVSGYVKDIYLPGRCKFSTGVVLPSSPVSWRSAPSNQQRSYTIVSQAQITSARNGGLVGIFAKADTNPLFAADKPDVVGGWSCSGDGLQAFPANTTPKIVAASLKASGHLFPDAAFIYNSFPDPDRSTADMLGLSASVADGISETWAIRVSLDTAAQGNHKAISMASYLCRMEGPSVEWIVQKINIQTTIQRWDRGLFGELDDRASSIYIASTIERVLNSMVMVGYGGLVNSNASSPNFATQGCLVRRTHIPWQVTSLLLVVTIMLFAMAAIWCIFWLLLLKAKKKFDPSDEEVLEAWTPNGLMGRMDYAIWENLARKDSNACAKESKEIKNWQLGRNACGSRPYGLVMDGEEVLTPLMTRRTRF